MTGGTYQVVRKVLMTIETWDFDRISDQQRIFGRTKDEGAPLTGEREFDTPDFALKAEGAHVIDQASHIALAAPENNGGVKILRRGYNYTDGLNPQGLLDAGLLFISYQNDPQHFVDLQNKLGRFDLLNEYIRHVGSAIFAVPPGPKAGSYIGTGTVRVTGLALTVVATAIAPPHEVVSTVTKPWLHGAALKSLHQCEGLDRQASQVCHWCRLSASLRGVRRYAELRISVSTPGPRPL